MRHSLLAALGVALVLLTTGAAAQLPPSELQFRAESLWDVYYGDEAKADLAITGKEIVVAFQVHFVRKERSVSKGLQYGVYAAVISGKQQHYVVCWFDDPKAVAKLKPEVVVHIKGTCLGWKSRGGVDQGDVIVTKCQLIDKSQLIKKD
jgi:hypothetical protein